MGRATGLGRIHAYVAALSALAIGVLALCVVWLDLSDVRSWGSAAALFLGLFVLAQFFPIRLPGSVEGGEFSTASTFAYALLLAVPLPVALLGIVVGIAIGDSRPGHRKPVLRMVFNMAQITLAFGAGGLLLHLAGAGATARMTATVLLVLLPSGLTMYAINILLTSMAIALDRGTPLRTVLAQDFAPVDMLTQLLLLAFAPVFVIVWQHSQLLLPLLLTAVAATYRATQAAIAGEHDSRHDSLTGLPNRRLLDERLAELLGASRSPEPFAVMVMDLDRFKQVNDVLGHQLGDELLVEVARRLTSLAGIDTVARTGGDEFAFVVRGRLTGEDLRSVAQHVVDRVAEPYTLQDVPLQIGASIGVARFPDHGHDIPTLLRRADTAMYRAKGTDTPVRLALATDERRSPGRISLVGDLGAALGAEQLRLDYQPQLALPSRDVVGLEALLRWDHPRHGAVVPERFVGTAEHTDLLPALTRYVIDHVLRDARQLTIEGRQLGVSVNVAARDLLDDRLARDVERLLASHDTSPEQLTIEVTENALLPDPERAAQVIAELVELGVGVSIDDFGTGYSSLTTLRDLPVTEVKIERSFVAGMVASRAGHRIVQAIIELARDLDLRVVAKGIEHPAELGELERLGCGIGQGYLLCRPLGVPELVTWLHARSRIAEPPLSGGAPAPPRLTGVEGP